MLYMNQQAIEQNVSMKEMIDAVEEAYQIYAVNAYQMPTRMQVQQGKNTLLLMPCMTTDAIATKYLTSFPENKDRPVIQGLVILNDSETGEVLAIMDGNYITGFRTGAIGGAAVRRLAKPNAKRLAVIGAGVQGFYQTLAACAERDFEAIYFANRTFEKIEPMIERLRPHMPEGTELHACESAEEAIAQADIIITATSSSDPVLPDDSNLFKGKLVIGVGSFQPSMREFPEALYSRFDYFFVDSSDAIKESGDVIQAVERNWMTEQDVHQFSDLFVTHAFDAEKFWKNHPEGSVVFKSTGMGLFDVLAARLIYEKVSEQQGGIRLE